MVEEVRPETKMYGRSWVQIIKVLFLLFLIGGVFTLIALNNIAPSDAIFPNSAWYAVLFIVVLTLYILWEAFNGRPNLIISSEGIAFNFTGQSGFHTWEEVGPFSIYIQSVPKFYIPFAKYILLCAYSNNTHQAINQDEDVYRASYWDGEIRFTISLLEVARNEEELYNLVDEINRRRNLRVTTEINNVSYSEEQIRKIWKKLARRINFWGGIFITAFATVFIYAVYQSLPSIITLYSNLID